MNRRRMATGMATLALLLAARILAAELVLVEDGEPRSTIVIAKDANEKAKRAAAELATYIEKMSGAKLAIATDDAAPAGPLVLVGASSLAKAAEIPIPSGLTNARREEGFVIATAGDRLILAGNDDGPYHGTEYAVYDFLRMLGVRWFMPGEFGEIVPRRGTIAVAPLRIEERPDFVMRNWWLHAKPELAEKERVWKLRNKMNPETMFATPGDSTVRNVLPGEVFKEHPEYFAMNADGSRSPHFPNLMHPKAVEMAAGVVKDYFRKNPGSNSYGFAPDDGLPRDYSPETVAHNQGFVELGGRPGVPGELSISEEWFGFVNRVAAKVRKEFPDRYLATNGYANRDIPPQGMAIDDHLVVMFAAIWSCTLHAYDDEHCWQKVRQGQMLRRWCELNKNVWIYGYNYGVLVSALTPIPMVHKLRRDFPLMKKWGVMGFLDEARNIWAECGIASRYLRAQLEWDADADVDAILADFYAKWYGEAAEPMRAFYDALERAIEDAPIHGHEDRVLPEVYTPELMARLRVSIAEAEKRATDERVRIRVRSDRLIFDHLDGYVSMSAAEAAGEFSAAAKQADRMLAIRKDLHAIDPFFIWYDEERYHSGVWYWGLVERKAFYESLADRTSGKTGDLVALCPDAAAFRADPNDEGVFAEWYARDLDEKGWGTVRTTRPFYVQGYQDERGHPFVGHIWYRLRADVPASAAGRKVILYVPVVETEAWCWINGKYVGHRPYQEAYIRPSPIEIDVSDAIRPGATNTIAIRVSTSLSPAQAASGILSRVLLYAPKEAAALDLREPMALAAGAIARRLDPAQGYRPWFLLRGRGGIPVEAEHASWDLGDMTGRYIEGLILARRMGISTPELSAAEGRLQRFLWKLLGPDGLVHDPDTGAVDHPFSQGSALYGLLAWYEDSGDPAVRGAAERLIAGLLRGATRDGDRLIVPAAKLPESSGSHLAGYTIFPAIRFHELTGSPDALALAEGLVRWAIDDPVLAPDGAISKPLSWEGHIHSWLDTLAGCVRAARISKTLDRARIVARSRAVYDWVMRTNATSFGWIATYPTGGSSETCAISSAIRLAIELASSGFPEYLADVERFARNQLVEAQFRDLAAYGGGSEPPTPLLLGCFDSQSMPNGHLGTRGGEDVGTVEGCCLNGGMRALALAWDSIVAADEAGITVNLALSYDGPAARVISRQPSEGRIDVIPRHPGAVRVRVPAWANAKDVSVAVDGVEEPWAFDRGSVILAFVPARARVTVRYPLREIEEEVVAGGSKFKVRWRGDVVIGVDPPGAREPAYGDRMRIAETGSESGSAPLVPDTYEIRDAARLAAMSILARMDLARDGQPFFRIYPFATPPRAEHEKWDDGDMTGRYVEALIQARRMTGIPMDPRERILRDYLAGLYDPSDGLAYTRGTAWTPRRACLFSNSCAMLGLLAWYADTGSARARTLLDRHVEGLMKIATDRGTYAHFPKYEYDGRGYIDDPPGRDAPTWYGGRLILPLVEYWKIAKRDDVKAFIEKLIRYSTEVSQGIRPDGEVLGNGWWGHLHSTMDMASGIAEMGRLTGRPEWIAWAKRVYDWIGRTHANRYGWVSDASGSSICESCAIASRIRLGLALHRAGAADPHGEIDRHIRNQLLENQFIDLTFLKPLAQEMPRTDRAAYAGIDRMIRGTFQCWGTANDLIGHENIEGCGAGGGVQGLALAWEAQAEWRGDELRIHLLFNRRIRGPGEGPVAAGSPVALELWSHLPHEGRAVAIAHRPIARLALRLPDGADRARAAIRRGTGSEPPEMDGPYAIIPRLASAERVELTFPLEEYETTERAREATYRVKWRGNAVLAIDPRGAKVPLYADRGQLREGRTPLSTPRYP